MKEDRSNWCIYFHPACAVGCDKVYCRHMFPEKQLIIMESQKPMCKSLEHRECLEFIAGNEYQEQRRLNKRGCTFLTNTVCGKPNQFWCKGATPPFIVEKDNFLSACFEAGYENCPNYIAGVAFREEARRKKEKRNTG